MSHATSNVQPHRSLDEVHRTVGIPQNVHWWRRMIAFAGPAYMVSVGYMDPGNWATDIEGGSRFGYRLIWVLLMSNLMAVLLQTLSARLGLVTGRDLAQACRDSYGRTLRWTLFLFCEVAIAACDLAEVLGTAIGLNLLTGIPLLYAVLITAGDVLLLLAMQKWGIRKMEAMIILLITTIGVCFIIEIFLARPSWGGIASGFVPRPMNAAQLYVAIGILGATVMPHNLYLHSSLVQSRDVHRSVEGVKQAAKFNLIDSVIALNAAFLVNAAILILAASAFHSTGHEVTSVEDAHHLLHNLLGPVAPAAFAIALICAGQSSTITGTLAGQITMEGFLHFRIRPWLRRLITRMMAIVPAVAVIYYYDRYRGGEAQGTQQLLVLSQVVLSLQLPFAIVPLVKFTGSKLKMGPFVSRVWVQVLAWAAALIVMALDTLMLVWKVIEWRDAWNEAGGPGWVVVAVAIPIGMVLVAILLWMAIKPERPTATRPAVCPHCAADLIDAMAAGAAMCPTCGKEVLSPMRVADDAVGVPQKFTRIGVALEAKNTDSTMLAEAISLARSHRAELILLHVVEGVGGQWYGKQTSDEESREDEKYLTDLVARLSPKLTEQGVPGVHAALGYGSVTKELIRLAGQERLDLMVVGGHGHNWFKDLIKGETITGLRHGLKIPVLAVRNAGRR